MTDTIIAILGGVATLVAILVNFTSILKFVQEQRERRKRTTSLGIVPSSSLSIETKPGITTETATSRLETEKTAVGDKDITVDKSALMQAKSSIVNNEVALAPVNQPHILTPDQRLRVFVSSTLQELAEERNGVKEAITSLHLSPVMFELGARPHPPRKLYRAYLEQSHIFVGIYWQRYGWVAPGESISGLEDEYQLSGSRPKLIYVKSPALEREEGLKNLLKQIQTDDQVSYRPFSTAEELQGLIKNDLALLLTERFEVSLLEPTQPLETTTKRVNTLPIPTTPLVGREEELAELSALLLRQEVRLVTLAGMGGIGKSRLALELGHTIKESFCDGVFFVPLASIRDTELVIGAMAQMLGLQGGTDLLEGLKTFLRDKQVLLVLDNFEQVMAAAPIISELLVTAPRLEIVVTSREILHLSGEYVYSVPPLSLATNASSPSGTVHPSEAVRLFVARAQAVKPDFALTPENMALIAEICQRLDGLPLAIELAAARSRLLSPRVLLERLGNSLDTLKGGARDLPTRQQTLKNTIDWSFQLLTQNEQTLFTRLGVFVGGCSLEAVEALNQDATNNVLEELSSLVDKSLINQREVLGEPRFEMLEILRDYALDKLEASGQKDTLRQRHASYYLKFAERVSPELRGHEQRHWLAQLGNDYGNLRALFA